jgi:hypothetical protein
MEGEEDEEGSSEDEVEDGGEAAMVASRREAVRTRQRALVETLSPWNAA